MYFFLSETKLPLEFDNTSKTSGNDDIIIDYDGANERLIMYLKIKPEEKYGIQEVKFALENGNILFYSFVRVINSFLV